MDICPKENCTGCFACVNSCPFGCIEMRADDLGFIYPEIDDKKCINCKKCEKVCPANTPASSNEPTAALAAWCLDEKEHKTSSSGGVAAAISKNIIENGGVVYGCSSEITDGEISHVRIDSADELFKLKGSKYTHSYINDCFTKAKCDLEEGKRVFFVGTPCQIAGLKNYLSKDYVNLLTADLICHGVPSQKFLFEEIGKQITDESKFISFRDGAKYLISLSNSSGLKRVDYPYHKSLYLFGFSKSLTQRESCYSCQYATASRVGDITLGDFWGLGKNKPFEHDTKNGVSVVLVNTEKGKQYIGELDKLFLEERSVDEAVDGNAHLKKPVLPHKNREKFISSYKKKSFKSSARESLSKELFISRAYSVLASVKPLRKALGKLVRIVKK